MVRAIDLDETLKGLEFLEGRTRQTPLEEEDKAFANLGSIHGGEIHVGGFSGASPWERHANGDELVQVLRGSATLTIMEESGPEQHDLRAGMILMVPQGLWHRFDAADGVTVMTITPPPTEHSDADDPR